MSYNICARGLVPWRRCDLCARSLVPRRCSPLSERRAMNVSRPNTSMELSMVDKVFVQSWILFHEGLIAGLFLWKPFIGFDESFGIETTIKPLDLGFKSGELLLLSDLLVSYYPFLHP